MNEDQRFSKIDDAIQRLAIVSSDISKMIAVHEQRLMQQEKQTDIIVSLLETRRKDVDYKIAEVYDTIKTENKAIIDEIKKSSEYVSNQNELQNLKITKIEKTIYMVTGAGMAVGVLFNILLAYLKFVN